MNNNDNNTEETMTTTKPLTRKEANAKLAEAGYSGPTSYGMDVLRATVDHFMKGEFDAIVELIPSVKSVDEITAEPVPTESKREKKNRLARERRAAKKAAAAA